MKYGLVAGLVVGGFVGWNLLVSFSGIVSRLADSVSSVMGGF